MFRMLLQSCQSRPMSREEALTFWISIRAVVLASLPAVASQ